jgi:hypothetical protein
MTESAIEQRLRRFCTKRKNGAAPCGDDVLKNGLVMIGVN